jgi:O-methyltransferase
LWTPAESSEGKLISAVSLLGTACLSNPETDSGESYLGYMKPSDFILKNPLFSPLRLVGWKVLSRILAAKNMMILAAGNEPRRATIYALIRQVRVDTQMILLDPEAYNIYAAATRTTKILGAIAEVGVFRGGSARLICEAKGNRQLLLFDTFAGMPETGEDDPRFARGVLVGPLPNVQAYLAEFPNVFFHQGFFPDSAAGLEEMRFSFVHLDVDIYQSTVSCLEWFYPRLNRGAMLISHDYPVAEGVRKAFDEFLGDKPECLIELSETQAAFIKL